MKYAFFQGCNIPARIEQYARSTQAVMAQFGVTLEEVREFNCCGYPMRNVDEKAYLLPSARNMAIAEQRKQAIAVICNCCYHSLMTARKRLAEDRQLREEINLILSREGLTYSGTAEIKHFLSILHNEIGLADITKKLRYQLTDLPLVFIQGCHVLRPREVTNFDSSFMPGICDSLLRCMGIEAIEWHGKLQCCGGALAGINDELSHEILKQRLQEAHQAGARYIVCVCSYCYLQFDNVQLKIGGAAEIIIPVLLLPQLLGLCLGLDEKQLAIRANMTVDKDDTTFLAASLKDPEQLKKKNKKRKKEAV